MKLNTCRPCQLSYHSLAMMACATASFGFKSMQHWLTNRMTLTEKKCVSCFYFLERCSWISLTTYRMLARFNAVRLFIFDDSSLIFEHYHRRSQGEAKGAMAPPIFGKYGDFVVWEAFFQTNYLPNIKHFAPPLKFLGWLRHWTLQVQPHFTHRVFGRYCVCLKVCGCAVSVHVTVCHNTFVLYLLALTTAGLSVLLWIVNV